MMKRIYVTLDTEMDNDPHWGKHFPPKYTSITEGIPQLLRPIWDKYNVHPIYFVSPEVLYYPPCVAILREEVQKRRNNRGAPSSRIYSAGAYLGKRNRKPYGKISML